MGSSSRLGSFNTASSTGLCAIFGFPRDKIVSVTPLFQYRKQYWPLRNSSPRQRLCRRSVLHSFNTASSTGLCAISRVKLPTPQSLTVSFQYRKQYWPLRNDALTDNGSRCAPRLVSIPQAVLASAQSSMRRKMIALVRSFVSIPQAVLASAQFLASGFECEKLDSGGFNTASSTGLCAISSYKVTSSRIGNFLSFNTASSTGLCAIW